MLAPTSAVLENFSVAAGASVAEPVHEDWVIDASGVYKKYCRNLRRSLWYGVRDILDALTLRSANSDSFREHEFWAVNDVSFQLRRGEALGLLGSNGAGKSTLLKLITGQRLLSAGTVRTRGRIVALNELGLGFNPVLTGRENAYVNAAVLGYSRHSFAARIEEMIDFAGIREFIDCAVQTYSTGMKARLGFAVATHLDPDILIIDEVLAVGDLEFRSKCVQHIAGYLGRGGSLLLVAHDPYIVQSICNRCLVLDRGRVLFDGSGIEGVNFHFKLGHNRRYDSIAETTELDLGAPLPQADAAVMQESSAGNTTEAPAFQLPSTLKQPVIVERFEMLAADGGPLISGCRAKIVLSCRSAVSGEIGWGFTLCTADLHTTIATCVKGMDGPISRVVPGANQFICVLPELPLRPGVYAIKGGVGDLATQAISVRGYSDAPNFFTVSQSEVNRTSNVQAVTGALVNIKSHWLS